MMLSRLRALVERSTAGRGAAARRMSVIAASRILASVVQFGTLAIVGRLMGVSEFGRFAMAMSLTMVVMSFLEFGLGNRSLRVGSDPRTGSTVSTVLSIRTVTNILVLVGAGLVMIATGILPVLESLLVILYVTGDLFGNLGQSLLIGLKREKSAATLLLTRRFATLLPLVGLLVLGYSGMWIYGALSVTGVVGYALTAVLLLKELGRPSNPFRFISDNRHFMTASVAANLQQADTLIIGALASPQLAGLYGAATRLASPLNLLPSSILQSVVPSLARQGDDRSRLKVFGSVRNIMTGIAAAMIICTPFVPWGITVLYGADFADAWPMAVAVVIACACNAVVQAYQSWYYATKVPPMVTWILLGNTIAVLGTAALAGVFDSVWISAAGMVAAGMLTLSAFAVGFNRMTARPILRGHRGGSGDEA